jgi:hypothetical protein
MDSDKIINEFAEEKIKLLNNANKSLNIGDDLSIERNRNLIIVYTPPKVGSTSLVSSLRLYLSNKYTVLHLHNEYILNILYNINNITINELIRYNELLGKHVFIIDIFRNPIEHKISMFFEDITEHFNNTEEEINNYKVERLINRFNNIFPYLGGNDYFRQIYNIDISTNFDHEKKYLLVQKERKTYIKLRLNDSKEWKNIIKQILGDDIEIVTDYETSKKKIGQMYNKFLTEYRLPINYLDNEINQMIYYNTYQETQNYTTLWKLKSGDIKHSYNSVEYEVYKSIVIENRNIIILDNKHYLDQGCICNICNSKREAYKLGKESIVVDHNVAEIKQKMVNQYIRNKKYQMDKLKEELKKKLEQNKKPIKKRINININI